MAIVNNLELNGTVYNLKKNEKMIKFSLSYYLRKNKETNKNEYGYKECICFNQIDIREKQPVIIKGKISQNSYKSKDGRDIIQDQIIVESIIDNSIKNNNDIIKDIDEVINDEIPF